MIHCFSRQVRGSLTLTTNRKWNHNHLYYISTSVMHHYGCSVNTFIVLSCHLLRKHSNCMLTVSSLHLYLIYNGSQPISDDFSDSTYIFAPLCVNKYLKTAGTIHRLAIYACTMSWVLIWLIK